LFFKNALYWWTEEVVYGSYDLFPTLREMRHYTLFPAKGNIKVAEWSARAQISHLLERSCGRIALILLFVNASTGVVFADNIKPRKLA
jgi:hypothetical protein